MKRARKTAARTRTIVASLALALAGCSEVSVRHHAAGHPLPLCGQQARAESGAVYWGVLWRLDQKEKEIREGMARSALETFFAASPCFQTAVLVRSLTGRDSVLASDEQILADARRRGVTKAVVLVVEELGPNVILYCSPILWATRNDIVFQVRLLDVKSGTLQARVGTRFERGGAFTFNGAETLSSDMVEALGVVFGAGR